MSRKEDRRSSSPPLLPVIKKICLDSEGASRQESLEGLLQKKKSVSFNEDMLEEVIHFEDDDDSKHGREKYWEFMAVDRQRFKDRCLRMEDVLSPVLITEHRNLVYTRMTTFKASSEAPLKQVLKVDEVRIVVVEHSSPSSTTLRK